MGLGSRWVKDWLTIFVHKIHFIFYYIYAFKYMIVYSHMYLSIFYHSVVYTT